MKFTLLPLQMELVPEIMLTDGVTLAITFMVIPALFTTEGAGQAAEEVSVHVTTSPLFNAEVTNVGEDVPTGLPFTRHW